MKQLSKSYVHSSASTEGDDGRLEEQIEEQLQAYFPLHQCEQSIRGVDPMLIELMAQARVLPAPLSSGVVAEANTPGLEELTDEMDSLMSVGPTTLDGPPPQLGLLLTSDSSNTETGQEQAIEPACLHGLIDPPTPSMGLSLAPQMHQQQAQEQLAPAIAEPPEEFGEGTLGALATEFLHNITTEVSEVAVAPPPQPRQRRCRNMTNTPLHRSRRIAAVGPVTNSVQRAQAVLMKRL